MWIHVVENLLFKDQQYSVNKEPEADRSSNSQPDCTVDSLDIRGGKGY